MKETKYWPEEVLEIVQELGSEGSSLDHFIFKCLSHFAIKNWLFLILKAARVSVKDWWLCFFLNWGCPGVFSKASLNVPVLFFFGLTLGLKALFFLFLK